MPTPTTPFLLRLITRLADDEADALRAADASAATLLRTDGRFLLDESVDDPIYQAIAQTALADAAGPAMRKAESALARWDGLTRKDDETRLSVTAAARVLYQPQLDAAYYIGLCVGLRLAGGAR